MQFPVNRLNSYIDSCWCAGYDFLLNLQKKKEKPSNTYQVLNNYINYNNGYWKSSKSGDGYGEIKFRLL